MTCPSFDVDSQAMRNTWHHPYKDVSDLKKYIIKVIRQLYLKDVSHQDKEGL